MRWTKERQFTKISWPLKMLNTRAGTTICADDNDNFSCFSCSNYISAHTGKIKWKCKFNDLFRHVRWRCRCRHCLCRCANCKLGKCTRFNLSKCSIFFIPQNSLNPSSAFLFRYHAYTPFQSQYDYYCYWWWQWWYLAHITSAGPVCMVKSYF